MGKPKKRPKRKSQYKKSVDRLALLFFVVLLGMFLLSARLAQLQILKHDEYTKMALDQWTKGIEIKPKRGVIYDRTGKKLAISVNSYTLWANPNDIKDKKKTAKELSKILKEPEKGILEKLESGKTSVKIKQWLEQEEAKAVEGLNEIGLQLADASKRYYPNEGFASYILGFTNIDNVGLNGIEKTYNEYLAGEPGKAIKIKDGKGKPMPYGSEKIYDSKDGYSIELTLDQAIQEIAENAAKKAMAETKAKNISILITDPNTGDILALANSPSYNPNDPRTPLDPAVKREWDKLKQKELQQEWYNMWRNYAISDAYEPGSTFKTIIAAAAIEENVANPDSHFYCSGFVEGTPLKCSRWYNPHRDVNLRDGLAASCNIVFVDLGRKLGKDKTLKYIKAFGFGEKTDIELLGEQAGIIPVSADAIRDINLATISYGHGVAVTPIQLINAVSALGNGGKLMIPRLVSKVTDSKGKLVIENQPEVKRQVISKATSDIMMDMMADVVSSGTGGSAYVPGYRVAGKTGTAQKIIDGSYAPGKYIGSFVAVAPADDPKLSILVIVDEPEGVYYGGSTAAPVAGEIIEKSLKYMNIEPKFTEAEKKRFKDLNLIPNVKGMSVKEAGEQLVNAGFKYTVDSDELDLNSKITEQYPEAGTESSRGAIVDLYVDNLKSETKVQVPNLMGKTQDQVKKALEDLGLKYQFEGEGKAVEQSPSAGSQVSIKSSIKVKFETED